MEMYPKIQKTMYGDFTCDFSFLAVISLDGVRDFTACQTSHIFCNNGVLKLIFMFSFRQ